jgi:hypothetical protein
VNERELPGPLKREIDKQPLGIIAEYLGQRIGVNTGTHEIRITLVDGRYHAGRVLSSFASLRAFAKLRA